MLTLMRRHTSVPSATPDSKIGFHEASIVGLRHEGGTVTFELEGVHLGAEMHSAIIQLKGVQKITRNGVQVKNLVMESDDGEILTLQNTGTTLRLLVEWNDFKKHHSQTSSYRITSNSIKVEIPQTSDDPPHLDRNKRPSLAKKKRPS